MFIVNILPKVEMKDLDTGCFDNSLTHGCGLHQRMAIL